MHRFCGIAYSRQRALGVWRTQKLLQARHHAVKLVGGIVEFGGEFGCVFQRAVDIALVVAQRRGECRDIVDDAVDLGGVDRLGEIAKPAQRAVEFVCGAVEALGQARGVRKQAVDMALIAVQGPGEAVDIADNALHLVGVDRFDNLADVLRDAGDIVDGAGDLGAVERFGEIAERTERRVQLVVGAVEILGECGGVAQQAIDMPLVVTQRLGEARNIVDEPAHLVGVDGFHQLVGIVGKHLQARRQRPDLLADIARALEELVDARRAVAQHLGKLIDILERVGDGGTIVGDELVDLPQYIVGLGRQALDILQQVLEIRAIGIDDRRRAILADKRLGVDRTAGQRDHGGACQSLQLQARLGVFHHRRALGNIDRRGDAARIVFEKVDQRDLANLEAVEQDRAAARKPGNRAAEDDLVGLVAARAAQTGKPQHKEKRGDDCRQREKADNEEIGLGFHSAFST